MLIRSSGLDLTAGYLKSLVYLGLLQGLGQSADLQQVDLAVLVLLVDLSEVFLFEEDQAALDVSVVLSESV